MKDYNTLNDDSSGREGVQLHLFKFETFIEIVYDLSLRIKELPDEGMEDMKLFLSVLSLKYKTFAANEVKWLLENQEILFQAAKASRQLTEAKSHLATMKKWLKLYEKEYNSFEGSVLEELKSKFIADC